ncbi:MAG: tyrosine/phenylalanine carboxypeptidase domain-containing protein [Bacteriovoracia bacterium]
MINKAEFFALYAGLLRGLNLVQQKSWNESELAQEFPKLAHVWRPLLSARYAPQVIDGPKRLALEELRRQLQSWDDPLEASLLDRRFTKIERYWREVEKPLCDAESLHFFLEDYPLLAIDHSLRPGVQSVPAEKLSSHEAMHILRAELDTLFPQHPTKITLSASTLARASTTKRGIRLREDASYTREELAMLTVHEGWVHLGSNLAGATQRELPWLAHWHPGVTGLQEGLALVAEIVSGHWNREREVQVVLRHKAAILALAGMRAREVWNYLCDHQLHPDRALEMTLRLFRGCPLSGGMVFGKELQYVLGLQQWLSRRDELSPRDVQIALSGKMDFLEWEVLRSTALGKRLKLATPPQDLLHWMHSPRLEEWLKTVSFKKIA